MTGAAAWWTPVRRTVLTHAAGLAPALVAGLIAFGGRAALTWLGVAVGTGAGYLIWRSVGRRGRLLDPAHLAWMSLVLAAMLPAHLAATGAPTPTGLTGNGLWPVLPAAGLLLAGATWLLGGTAGGRVFPPLLVALVVLGTLGDAGVPRLALVRERALVGDLLSYDRRPLDDLNPRPWVDRRVRYDRDAAWRTQATDVLTAFTARRNATPDRPATMADVLRDRLPPMEDLIVLGHPRPAGMASVAAVLAGGLFLFYRGLADVRVAVLAVGTAWAFLVLAPVPASIGGGGAAWTWGLGLPPSAAQVDWEVALTFAHYELLAGPIVFAAVYLAPLPSLRPLRPRARLAYAVLAGVSMAAAGRYVDARVGPLGALLLVSLLSPTFDRLSRARTLV